MVSKTYSKSSLGANIECELSLISKRRIIWTIVALNDQNVFSRLKSTLSDRAAQRLVIDLDMFFYLTYQVETSLVSSGLVGIDEHWSS